MPSRVIILRNYSKDEGSCACGCKLRSIDECMVAMQAFHDILERLYGRPIRHVITGGARCNKHNAELQKQGIKTSPNSQHTLGKAIDGVFDQYVRGLWERLRTEDIATKAIQCGLFGGVGYMRYKREGQDFIHLDIRDGACVVW